ncbi:MAG TPA: GNAT family N-acetyltransferase [Pirellulales bacterium]|jgi:ribosomal protein S18 acetylase RimI-like enzyme
MNEQAPGDCDISVALPREQHAGLELVLADVPPARRSKYVAQLIESARQGRVDLAGLLIARRHGDMVGAVWGQPQPGRTASVWPPAVVDQQAACDGLLLNELIAWLESNDIRVAQSLLRGKTAQQAALLMDHGFAHLADLLYMVCPAGQFPRDPPTSSLIIEPAPQTDVRRLPEMIARTYEETLDCPQLNGVRDLDDVLAGYRACGEFDPARWLIARRGEQDVGCLLLADHPDEDQWELVYAGLVPEERGRGDGRVLTRYAQFLAGQAGRARLVLAVDAANAPAVATYERAGFVAWDRRSAYLRIFPHGG